MKRFRTYAVKRFSQRKFVVTSVKLPESLQFERKKKYERYIFSFKIIEKNEETVQMREKKKFSL